MDDDAAWTARLARFLREELARDDLPVHVRDEYERRLEAAGVSPPPPADASVDLLELTPRTRTALKRAGIRTVGELAALSDGERAALPNIGPLFLSDIRIALGET